MSFWNSFAFYFLITSKLYDSLMRCKHFTSKTVSVVTEIFELICTLIVLKPLVENVIRKQILITIEIL